jgi:hypothetical protein
MFPLLPGEFRFRVSDALQVPLRGLMLRLGRLEGNASIKDLAVGRRIRLTSPTGESRELTIVAHSVVGGRQTQKRLDQLGELDVIVAEPDGAAGGSPVDIGWVATGPVGSQG